MVIVVVFHITFMIVCGFILVRRSLFLDLDEYGPEIEHTLSKIRANERDSKKKMTEEQTPPPKQLKEYSLQLLMIHLRVPVCPLLQGHLRLNIPQSKYSHPFVS